MAIEIAMLNSKLEEVIDNQKITTKLSAKEVLGRKKTSKKLRVKGKTIAIRADEEEEIIEIVATI